MLDEGNTLGDYVLAVAVQFVLTWQLLIAPIFQTLCMSLACCTRCCCRVHARVVTQTPHRAKHLKLLLIRISLQTVCALFKVSTHPCPSPLPPPPLCRPSTPPPCPLTPCAMCVFRLPCAFPCCHSHDRFLCSFMTHASSFCLDFQSASSKVRCFCQRTQGLHCSRVRGHCRGQHICSIWQGHSTAAA